MFRLCNELSTTIIFRDGYDKVDTTKYENFPFENESC